MEDIYLVPGIPHNTGIGPTPSDLRILVYAGEYLFHTGYIFLLISSPGTRKKKKIKPNPTQNTTFLFTVLYPEKILISFTWTVTAKKSQGVMLRLILMRIRFRASIFGQVAKITIMRANRNRLLVQRWCPCHLFFCSCDSAASFFENASQRRPLLCPAPRRVHFAWRWTQASKPMLIDSCLAAKRRASELHVVFFSTKHPSPAR